jgi:hypothetical protein
MLPEGKGLPVRNIPFGADEIVHHTIDEKRNIFVGERACNHGAWRLTVLGSIGAVLDMLVQR